MKCLPKILLSVSAAAGIAGCVNQSNDLEPCDTETGIRLLFDWISSAPRDDTQTLRVAVTGSASDYDITSPTTGRDLEILPGTYSFTAWETAGNVTLDGTTVTVASSDGVASEPQEFTAGTVTDTILDQEALQTVTVPMYGQTRDLIIRLRFIGAGVSLIRSASGTVDGIALSRDIVYGFPPVDGRLRPLAITSGSIGYDFIQASDGWYTGRRTLLGIDGDSNQIFHVSVGFDEDYSIGEQLDFTAELNLFHTQDVDEPWVISITLEVGLSLDMVIVDWNSGTESWLEAQ